MGQALGICKGKGSQFVGTYSDPNHPDGWREIKVAGSELICEGVDETDGAKWTIPLKVISATKVLCDFSVKGGPKDLQGTLTDEGGISWPDGNVWPRT